MTRSLGRCYRTLLARCTKQWEVRSLSLHLRCCYGLTLCTSCILYQLATRATLDNKDIICYKEETLAKYSLPSDWLAGLGWGGEHLMDSMQDVVNTTVSVAREMTIVEQAKLIR